MTSRISRRTFLRGLSTASIGLAAGTSLRSEQPAGPPRPQADARKLRERIETLSTFGRPAGGSFTDGVSRIAYSDADVAGRRYVMAQIAGAGLQPRIDPAGNIFARRAGTEDRLPPI